MSRYDDPDSPDYQEFSAGGGRMTPEEHEIEALEKQNDRLNARIKMLTAQLAEAEARGMRRAAVAAAECGGPTVDAELRRKLERLGNDTAYILGHGVGVMDASKAVLALAKP